MFYCLLIEELYGSVGWINIGSNEGTEINFQGFKSPGQTLAAIVRLPLGTYDGIVDIVSFYVPLIQLHLVTLRVHHSETHLDH